MEEEKEKIIQMIEGLNDYKLIEFIYKLLLIW